VARSTMVRSLYRSASAGVNSRFGFPGTSTFLVVRDGQDRLVSQLPAVFRDRSCVVGRIHPIIERGDLLRRDGGQGDRHLRVMHRHASQQHADRDRPAGYVPVQFISAPVLLIATAAGLDADDAIVGQFVENRGTARELRSCWSRDRCGQQGDWSACRGSGRHARIGGTPYPHTPGMRGRNWTHAGRV
jgi:hypothetical protein